MCEKQNSVLEPERNYTCRSFVGQTECFKFDEEQEFRKCVDTITTPCEMNELSFQMNKTA